MNRYFIAAPGIAVSALLMISPTMVSASKEDRARAAIQEATGKIDAANKIGVGATSPQLAAQAEASLRTAREDLARGHKTQAIADANHASQLADTAIGEAQRSRVAAEAAQRQEVMAAAQHETDAANARTDVALQSAAIANADAANARATPAPIVMMAPMAAPTTTVTTETVKATSSVPATVVKRKVVRRAVRRTPVHATSAVTEKTTTTVTTRPN